MVNFLSKAFALLVFVGITVIIVNYVGDYRHYFHHSYEDDLSMKVLGGERVRINPNYNERYYIYRHIERQEGFTNYFIGSSRGMLLDQTIMKDSQFFNVGVSGADVYDLVFTLEKLVKNKKPESIVIGLDPWMFSSGYENEECFLNYNGDKSLFQEYYGIDLELFVDKRLKLIELGRFQKSFDYIITQLSWTPSSIDLESSYEDSFTYEEVDGSIIYGRDTYVKDSLSIYKIVSEKIRRNEIYGMKEFTFDEEKWRVFERLIDRASSLKISVSLYLEPFNPRVYDYLYRNIEDFKKLESLYRKLVYKSGMKIIGSYDPNIFELHDGHFYDEMHCNNAGILKVINRIKLSN